MEYLDGGELFERVAADDFNLTESDCCLFMRQICRGVQYLHNHNIVHLDLKVFYCQFDYTAFIKPLFESNKSFKIISYSDMSKLKLKTLNFNYLFEFLAFVNCHL